MRLKELMDVLPSSTVVDAHFVCNGKSTINVHTTNSNLKICNLFETTDGDVMCLIPVGDEVYVAVHVDAAEEQKNEK